MKPLGQASTYTSTLYGELRHHLLAGLWKPGLRLPIKDICRRYEVSLSPAREALSRLAAEGFVVRIDHRGFRVAAISREDLLDLTNVRCEINNLALRDAIAHGDEAWAEGIVLAFHRLSRIPRFDPEGAPRSNLEWDARHREFHASLIAGAQSVRLRNYCDQLFDQTERYRGLAAVLNLTETKRRAGIEHKDIMDATLERDSHRAADLMTQHLKRTSQKLLDNWEKLEGLYGRADERAAVPRPRSESLDQRRI